MLFRSVARVRGVLAPLCRSEDPTLIIAHQSVNRVIGHVLTGLPPADMLAVAQRSDVLLRYAGAEVAHAFLPAAADPLRWIDGLFFGGPARLN